MPRGSGISLPPRPELPSRHLPASRGGRRSPLSETALLLASCDAASLPRWFGRALPAPAAVRELKGEGHRNHGCICVGKPAHSAEAASGRRLFLSGLITLASLALAAPWFVQAAVSLLAAGSTTPIDWVPASFPARRDYDAFTAAFTRGDVVVASWPDCRLGSAAVASVLDAATDTTALPNAEGPWFDEVTSATPSWTASPPHPCHLIEAPPSNGCRDSWSAPTASRPASSLPARPPAWRNAGR